MPLQVKVYKRFLDKRKVKWMKDITLRNIKNVFEHGQEKGTL